MSMSKKRDIGSYIPVTVSDSEDDSDSDVEGDVSVQPDSETIKINLFDKNAFEPTPQPPKKAKPKRRFTNVMRGQEPLQVFLRVRPILNEELEAGEDQGCIEIANGHDILLTAPKSSQNYKNFLRGTSKASHKYTFSKILDPATKQKEFFEESTLQTVQDFVNGQNCLVFTYGVTNSGKTYTIQGTSTDPGILPRSLDVLFNSVEAQLDDSGRFQPNMFSSVVRLSDEDIARGAKDKKDVMMMSVDMETAASNAANTTVNSTIAGETSVCSTSDSRLSQCDSDRGSLSSGADSSARPSIGSDELEMLPEINREIEDMAVDIQGQGNVKFSIWVSFAEIYNEFIYDLLDKIPTLAKGKKFMRRVLRLSDDPNGNVFIRGLKKICVKNADEAYRVMLAGQKNLHKAATKLNHNSSRSHCIFTISLVRIVDAPSPKVARTSMLHLVDLAGSERQKKTGSEGERLKESSNINTTLLTLGKCIQAMKFNQNHPANKHQIVPFRESRLTRLFQTFFQGKGRAMMIVNVNQLASTFDETLHAIKFSAIAKEVVILTQPEPPPKEIKEKKIMGPPAPPANKNAAKGKTSVAAKPGAKAGVAHADTAANKTVKDAKASTSASAKEAIDLNVTTSSEGADGSCRCKDVPTEFYTIEQGNHMKSMIDTLKDNLKKKGRENREMEMRIRQEVTEEMAQQLVKIQDEADERVTEAKNEAEEMMEKRIELLQEGFAAQNDRQARKRRRGEEDEEKMTSSMKKRLEDQQHRVEALQTENSKLQFDLSAAKSRNKELKSRADQSSEKEKKFADEVKELKAQLTEKTHAEAELIDHRELITSLQQQLSAQREKNSEILAEKDELKVIVDEAATAFMEKESETAKLQEEIDSLAREKSIFAQEKEKLEEKIDELSKGSRQHESELQSRLQSDQSEIKRLTDDLKDAESRAKDAELANAESTKELNVAKKRLEESANMVESLQRDLESLDSEKTSTENEVGDKLREMRNRVSERDGELASLTKDLEEKTLEAAENRDKLLEEYKKTESLSTELDAEKAKLDHSAAEKEAALKTVDDLKKKITAIEIENENMKVETSEAMEEKEKLSSELDRLLGEEDERTNVLKNELESRLKEVNAKEEERAKAANEAEDAKRSLAEAKSTLNEKLKELMEQGASIRHGQERIAELSAELKEAKLAHVDDEFAAGKAEARLNRAKEELQTTKERLNYKEIEVEKIKVDSAKAIADAEETKKEAEKTLREEKLKLEREIADLQDQMKRETDSLRGKRSEVVELQRQVESLEREVSTKTKQIELQSKDLETRKQVAEAEKTSLCENYRKILEEQEFAMDAQDKVIKQRDETCEKLEEQVKDLEKKYQSAKSNEGLQNIVDEFKNELRLKSEEVEKLVPELSHEKNIVKDLQSQADATKLEIVRFKERIAELERLVDAKTSALEAVNLEKSQHEAVISVLENQVMEIRNQLVSMTNSDNSGSDIRRLEAEVESLKAYKLACDKRMSDKEDDLVAARQELKIAETKNMEEIARLKEEKMRSEDKLNQFKKDRDQIVDELGLLIKKRDNKIKELEEKLKRQAGQPQSASKLTSIKKKVKVSDAVEEDFLTASSDSDTNEAAPGRKRRSVETQSTSGGKTPDAKAPAFVRPDTEPKRRKTANSAVKDKTGARSSSRATRGASETNVEDQEDNSNSSPPAKPPRSNAEDTEDEFKENESARKRAGRSTRQSTRKTTASASKPPLQECIENDNESEPSDESEEGAEKKEKNKPRRKLYTQPDEPTDSRIEEIGGEEQENWGFSPLMRKLDREAPVKTRARPARSTRNK